MNIEPVIEKEVSQKESQIFNIYIYIYIYGIQKNITDEPICTAGIETQLLRKNLRTELEKDRVE